MKTLLVSFVLLAGLSSSAHAAPREFSLALNVLKHGDSCELKVAAIAQRLSAVRELRVIETSCEEGVEYWDRATVRYEAPHAVYLHTTYLGTQSGGPETGRTVGVYRKMQDCIAEVAERSAEFSAVSGVELFFANCEVAALDFGQPFLMTFYSLERPKVRLWQHEWELGTPNEFKALLLERLAQGRGLLVKEVDDRRVFFYAKDRPEFKMANFARYREMSECEAELPIAEAILRGAGQKWGQTLCKRGSYGTGLPSYANLISFGEGASLMPGWPTASAEYLTYAGCAKDRQRQLAEFERRNGRKALGGICSPESDNRVKLSIYTGWAS